MTIHLELGDEQTARLDRFASALSKSRDEATAQLIEEGLRHAEFPAVEFRDSAVGRQAYLAGSGLAIWEVLMVAESYELDASETAKHLVIGQDRIDQALRYAIVFEREIRPALNRNRAITADSLRRSLPPGSILEIL